MTPEADEAGGGWEGEEVLDDVLLVVAARCVEARVAAQVFLEEALRRGGQNARDGTSRYFDGPGRLK